MKALVLTSPGKVEIVEMKKPVCQQDEVLVKLKAAALNKRDQFIREGRYPNIQLNAVLGSDGVGEVVEVGPGADKKWMGQTVIINPNRDWGDNKAVQSRDYSILGMPSHGTFAEYISVPAHRVHRIPQGLKEEEAAALPLAGLTAYRACFYHGKITDGVNVLISGFGGGVAQFAFQFAMAVGAKVFVTSGRPEKINMALDMGAEGGFNYKLPNWHKNPWQTKGGFDVVIDSAGGDQFNNFLKIMRPGGRIVFYGATNGLPSSLDLYRMFWNQITLQGSTMGNDTEFVEMLRFVEKNKIKPLLSSVRDFDDIEKSFNEIAQPAKMGKVVVKF
ncbi:quinone oxidoreductase family protein [Fulvivirga sediminis]|uniref:Zinc-binding dehydrogenase n=1 Tax=Fulvivirga sediminis TaxID=2803949 RepID=A0A937F7C0_9BACT|nr:zinc-binding dehydrogenase [Fulvivirga sediminis]MBL3655665.1 zinc-binding dehydrogenase [Fulvivirga sediminis]